MANKRIDQLPQSAGPQPHYYVAIRNMDNNVTERLEISHFMTSQVSGNFEWDNEQEYLTDEVVTYGGFWYQALVDNDGVVPGTDEDTWLLLNRSASGFVQWQAGVFVEDEVYVLNLLAGYTQIFRLADAARPYVSSNFYTELADGDWELMSEINYIAIYKAGHGFAVNRALTYTGAGWIVNNTTAPSLAIVKTVVDADRVIVALTGPRVKGFTGLTAGSIYYRQEADGSITTTVSDHPVGVAISTTEIVLLASGGSGGGGAWGDITGTITDQTDLVEYVQDEITEAVTGLFDDRGNYDPTSTSNYPTTGGSGEAGAILKGDIWTISVAGTIDGIDVEPGDTVRALVDTPGTTATNWSVLTHAGEGSSAPVVVTSNISGDVDLDLSTGDVFILTITGDVTSFDFINEVVGKQYIFKLIKSTTEKAFTWQVNKFRFPSGNAPVLTNPTTNGSSPEHSEDIIVGLCSSSGRLDIVTTSNLIEN